MPLNCTLDHYIFLSNTLDDVLPHNNVKTCYCTAHVILLRYEQKMYSCVIFIDVQEIMLIRLVYQGTVYWNDNSISLVSPTFTVGLTYCPTLSMPNVCITYSRQVQQTGRSNKSKKAGPPDREQQGHGVVLCARSVCLRAEDRADYYYQKMSLYYCGITQCYVADCLR